VEVLVIYTGGTIGMKHTPNGYAPKKDYMKGLLKTLPMFHDPAFPDLTTPISAFGKRIHYDILEYDPLLDSSNMDMDDWARVAEDIGKFYSQYDAFVVLHGTDTMGYTSSALSFMLENLGKSVVITGSQVPMSEQRNDGISNFLGALTMAGHFVIPEVCVFFDNKLLRGCRTCKTSASDFDAFHSPNLPPLASIGCGIDVDWDAVFRPHSLDRFRVFSKMDANVAVLRFFPGITLQTLQMFLRPPIRGVVLQTFGAGNGPDSRADIMECLKSACDSGIVILNITQCHRGYVTDVYAAGRALKEAGIVPGGDMTPECALTKLAYVLAHNDWDLAKKKEVLVRNIRGERRATDGAQRFTMRDESFVEKMAVNLNAFGDEMKFFKDAIYPVLMCSAAGDGNIRMLEMLEDEGGSLSTMDYDGRTALHLAAAKGHSETVKWLLSRGALLHQKDVFGFPPLMDAIRGRSLESVEALVDAGAQLPFHVNLAPQVCMAAVQNDSEMLKLYIAANVDINITDYDRRTPLMVAITAGNKESTMILLGHPKVNVALKDVFGKTAADYAKEKGMADVVEKIKSLEMMHTLTV